MSKKIFIVFLALMMALIVVALFVLITHITVMPQDGLYFLETESFYGYVGQTDEFSFIISAIIVDKKEDFSIDNRYSGFHLVDDKGKAYKCNLKIISLVELNKMAYIDFDVTVSADDIQSIIYKKMAFSDIGNKTMRSQCIGSNTMFVDTATEKGNMLSHTVSMMPTLMPLFASFNNSTDNDIEITNILIGFENAEVSIVRSDGIDLTDAKSYPFIAHRKKEIEFDIGITPCSSTHSWVVIPIIYYICDGIEYAETSYSPYIASGAMYSERGLRKMLLSGDYDY